MSKSLDLKFKLVKKANPLRLRLKKMGNGKSKFGVKEKKRMFSSEEIDKFILGLNLDPEKEEASEAKEPTMGPEPTSAGNEEPSLAGKKIVFRLVHLFNFVVPKTPPSRTQTSAAANCSPSWPWAFLLQVSFANQFRATTHRTIQ